MDYLATPGEVVIQPSQNFQGCFNLSVINDDIFEADEDFFLTIATEDDKIFVNNNMATITIQDDDGEFLLQQQQQQ